MAAAARAEGGSIQECEYDAAWRVMLERLDRPTERAVLEAAGTWQTLLAWWRDLQAGAEAANAGVGGLGGVIEALVSRMPSQVREMWTDEDGQVNYEHVMIDIQMFVDNLRRAARAAAAEAAADQSDDDAPLSIRATRSRRRRPGRPMRPARRAGAPHWQQGAQ